MRESDIGMLLIGGRAGVILSAVVATPFYGFGPVLVVSGGLLVLAFVFRIFGGTPGSRNRQSGSQK